MNTFLNDVRDTIIPGHDPRHGPLPPLLLIMTVVAALVDSFSFLTLGHVFVANSTGNILFIGFALAFLLRQRETGPHGHGLETITGSHA